MSISAKKVDDFFRSPIPRNHTLTQSTSSMIVLQLGADKSYKFSVRRWLKFMYIGSLETQAKTTYWPIILYNLSKH